MKLWLLLRIRPLERSGSEGLIVGGVNAKNRRTSAGREETDERQKTRRLYGYVRRAGRAGGGNAVADGTVSRNWQAGQRQAGKGRGCRSGRASEQRIS